MVPRVVPAFSSVLVPQFPFSSFNLITITRMSFNILLKSMLREGVGYARLRKVARVVLYITFS